MFGAVVTVAGKLMVFPLDSKEITFQLPVIFCEDKIKVKKKNKLNVT